MLVLVLHWARVWMLHHFGSRLHFVLARQCVRHTTVFEVRSLRRYDLSCRKSPEDLSDTHRLAISSNMPWHRPRFHLAYRTELPVLYTNGRNRMVYRLFHDIREMGFHLPWPAKVQLPVRRKYNNALNTIIQLTLIALWTISYTCSCRNTRLIRSGNRQTILLARVWWENYNNEFILFANHRYYARMKINVLRFP